MKGMLKATSLAGILLLSLFIVIPACKKDKSEMTSQEAEQFGRATSESDAEAEIMFDDVFDNVMGVNTDVGIGGTGIFGQRNIQYGEEIIAGVDGTDTVPACVTVTITRLNPPAAFPVKVVIDFGTGCTGRDGRLRKGKIITVYTARLVVPGSVAETTFENYSVNGIKVEGIHRVENKSTSQQWIFNITVRNGKLTKPNGNYTQWNSTKTITQIEGNGTPLFPLDDVFSIKGESAGTVKRDSTLYQWAARTLPDHPLIKRFACRWIVKGKIAIRRTNSDVAVIDYGSGQCDNKAYITINGATFEITLH
ncbi:MAG TPA: hypothetical protein VD993_19780 [Chitinophagaceae bacterium]|nr:hypothetical protein [Chitinophagaceae bacterium]